jgi:ubiquinone/menaquinone biosynthesis C-methylase UbiE
MDKNSIFVVMPFRKELDNVYFAIQTIGKDLNCEVIRVDELQTTDKITDRILTDIIDSNLIVADVTHHNANVFYEVGYAFAVGKELLLIAKNVENLPFDIKGYNVATYSDETNVRTIINNLKAPIDKSLQRSIKRANLTKPLIEIIGVLSKKEPSEHLFDKLIEIRLNEAVRDLKSWTAGKMDTGPKEAIIKGIQIFHNLKCGGFATYLAPISGYWSMNKEYLTEGRKVVKDGKKLIERVYILPTYQSLFSTELRNLISEDEKSNVKTYVAFSTQIPKEAVRDFGIWDDEVLCLINTVENPQGRTEVRGCLFTKNSTEISTAKYWKDEILKVSYSGKKVLEGLSKADVNECLLPISADIMEDYAEIHCRGSYINKGNCSWYHTSWQYLRLLDLVSTPFWHNNFYIKHIQQEMRERNENKVLISGTADYAMLQHVHKASKENTIKPDITILDLCRTPLEICRWYADRYMSDYNINFVQKDAKNTDFKDGTFDIIVTDAFLTRFKQSDRKKFVNEWSRLLDKSGVIITTIRLNSGKDQEIKSKTGDVHYYIHKAKIRLEKKELLHPIKDKILDKAKLYAENIISYPFREKDAIQKLFNDFEVIIEVGKTPGEMIEQTTYARVIARKK